MASILSLALTRAAAPPPNRRPRDRANAVPPHGLPPVPTPLSLSLFRFIAAAAAAAALDLDDQRGGPPGRPSNGPRDSRASARATDPDPGRARDEQPHSTYRRGFLPGAGLIRAAAKSRASSRSRRHATSKRAGVRASGRRSRIRRRSTRSTRSTRRRGTWRVKRVDLVRINRSRDRVSLVVGQLGDGATRKDEPSSRSRRRTAAPNGPPTPAVARWRRRRGTERGGCSQSIASAETKGRARSSGPRGGFPGFRLPVGFAWTRPTPTRADRSSAGDQQPREGRRRCPVHSRGFTAVRVTGDLRASATRLYWRVRRAWTPTAVGAARRLRS